MAEKYASDAYRRRLKLALLEKHAGEPVTEDLCGRMETEIAAMIAQDHPHVRPRIRIRPLGLTAISVTIRRSNGL